MIPSTWYAPHFLLPPSPLSATGGALGARSLSLNPEKSERNAHRATLYTATGPNSKGKGVVNDGNRDHYNHPKTAHR